MISLRGLGTFDSKSFLKTFERNLNGSSRSSARGSGRRHDSQEPAHLSLRAYRADSEFINLSILNYQLSERASCYNRRLQRQLRRADCRPEGMQWSAISNAICSSVCRVYSADRLYRCVQSMYPIDYRTVHSVTAESKIAVRLKRFRFNSQTVYYFK